jgi:hypothetical protein
MGLDWVKLEWRAAPLGTPFSDPQAVIGSSATWQAVNPTGMKLSEVINGLNAGTPYHWQARLRYHPNNRIGQLAGPWMSLSWNGAAEEDFRTNDIPISVSTVTNDSPTLTGKQTIFETSLLTGTNVVYTWDFGDGTYLSTVEPSVSHIYTHSGNYWASVAFSNNANAVVSGTSVNVYGLQVVLPLTIKH